MQPGVITPGRAIGDDVAGHGRQTADNSALPHPSVLVNCAEAAEEDLVPDPGVSAQGGVVRHHDIVANDGVVADVSARHEQIVGADARHAAALGRAAVEGAVLADRVVGADLEPDGFTLVAIVLGVAADDGKGMHDRTGPDGGVLLNHDVADKHHAFAERDARADRRPGPDDDIVSQDGRRVHQGGGMDARHQETG